MARASRIGAALTRRLGPQLARRAAGRPVTATELAVPLRRMCEDLGATFTKYGQLIASSPSLFGEAMAAELRSCLDTGPGVSLDAVVTCVEASIGGPLASHFERFDEVPIGRASLAVVHRARLHDGTDVAVKVLRPGIEATVAADLVLMRRALSGLGSVLVPGLAELLVELVDGLRQQLEEELDLRNEAEVMAYFRSLPELALLPLVAVPEPNLDLSSRRVLVMEYLDGVAIDQAAVADELGLDAATLVEQVVKAWFLSALRGGVFHGDVHAGNILLLRDGRAGIIDWGIVGRLSPDSHWLLRRFIAGALGDQDAWDELADHLHTQTVASGIAAQGVSLDRATLRALLRDQVAGVVNKPFGELSLSDLIVTLQGQVGQLRTTTDAGGSPTVLQRLRRARSLRPPPQLTDRGMLLLAKQLAYFERYGTMYLGDVAVLRDEAFFRAALDGSRI